MESKNRISAYCMVCLVQKQLDAIKDKDEAIQARYMKDVFHLISESASEEATPVVIGRINELHEQYFGAPYSFEEVKQQYNHLVLEEEENLRKQIEEAFDPIGLAMRFARTGNYIDFGTLNSVNPETLHALMKKSEQEDLNETEYAHFLAELQDTKSLVYLTDNCGEIVLDKLLIEQLKKVNPNLTVTVIVRGKPILNDATEEDARMVGLEKHAEILNNGNGIAGTWISTMDLNARERLEEADLIISKGQANFESLQGCGHNIYYLFLCKCEWFVRRFNMEKYKGVFVNERRLS